MKDWSVTNVKGNSTSMARISFDLMEDDCVVARVTRPSRWAAMKFKFFTENSQNRFDNFCDSLSREEVASILISKQEVSA